MRVLNVGAARRLSAVASLCTVGLVVSSCGMVTITPKNAGEPTAGTLTGLPSPAETAGARGSAAGRSVFARRPLRRCGYGRCRPLASRASGWAGSWRVGGPSIGVCVLGLCSCVVRALRAMCPHSSQVVAQGHGCSAVPSGVYCGRRWPCLCVVLI